MERSIRYRDDHVVYGGVAGENLTITSAGPRNHHQAISDPDGCAPVAIDAKLFVPCGHEDALWRVPVAAGTEPSGHRSSPEANSGAGRVTTSFEYESRPKGASP